MRAVRRGSVWRDAKGEVKVYGARRLHWPTDARLVAFGNLDETTVGVLHEVDFRKRFEWVRGKS